MGTYHVVPSSDGRINALRAHQVARLVSDELPSLIAAAKDALDNDSDAYGMAYLEMARLVVDSAGRFRVTVPEKHVRTVRAYWAKTCREMEEQQEAITVQGATPQEVKSA